jgi:hypothetical protein
MDSSTNGHEFELNRRERRNKGILPQRHRDFLRFSLCTRWTRFGNSGLLFRENLDGRYNLTELGPMRSEGGDAYSRYNALLRELISFEQALDRRIRQSRKAPA